jgi:hypothetical protein
VVCGEEESKGKTRSMSNLLLCTECLEETACHPAGGRERRCRRAEGGRRRAKHEEKQGIIPQGGEVVEGGERAEMVKRVKL